MKFLCGIIILLCTIPAQELMQEQLEINIKKALDLHQAFLEDYWQSITSESNSLIAQTNDEVKSHLQTMFSESSNAMKVLTAEMEEVRSEFIKTESQKYVETFDEIKNQGTPEVMLVTRSVALGHSLFHALQKDYEDERRKLMELYFSYIESAFDVAKVENSEELLQDKKSAFELEENIKKRSHNVTHTFQVLREFEFSEEEKQWIFDRMHAQIVKEENQRAQKIKVCDTMFAKYQKQTLQEKKQELQKQELTQEQIAQHIDQESFIKASLQKITAEEEVSYAERKAKYFRDLAMFSERRIAGLQREIYYFKSFIDGEIKRYQDTQFPQSIIDTLQQRHWDIFLEMTDINLKRWLDEDNILLLRHVRTEVKLYGYNEVETEETLQKFLSN